MPRVVHFEINAANPESLTKFYEQVFSWKFEKWKGPMDYWLIMTGKNEPGIDGGLTRRTAARAATVNTISVPSIDEYIEKIKEHKGTIIVPKTAIPGVGWTAYFEDPEGNSFGLMEEDTTAK
ncbi:MAG: VOC family protein [Candidatus Bathyarchaeota archaeon]|nr:MAG: VOC family protein [Candidatus Bathyarchaeota archaeon]